MKRIGKGRNVGRSVKRRLKDTISMFFLNGSVIEGGPLVILGRMALMNES